MKVNNLKNYKEAVIYWLSKYEHLRDSDTRLLANIWASEVGSRINQMNAVELLKMMAEGKLPSAETIRRTRQKVQEEMPELRGESYRERQSRGAQFTKEIHEIGRAHV